MGVAQKETSESVQETRLMQKEENEED